MKLYGRGASIEQGRRLAMAGQWVAHHGLEVEPGFEAPLGDLRLVGVYWYTSPGSGTRCAG